jgi:Protein of unknown function (DUF4238)
MSNRVPRRQHTVPRLYLRAFADRDQVVMRRRGATGDEVRNIAKVAFTRDFYGFAVDGVRDVTVETWLERNVEAPGAPALRRILDGQWPPLDADRRAIASFAAFQLLRTPLVRAFMHQIDRTTAPLLWSAEVLSRTLAQVALTDDEKLQVLAEARARTPAALIERTDPRAMLRTMIREADRNVPRLLDRGWSLLRSDAPVLVTSDNPVAKFFPNGSPAGFRGMAPPEAELHLPLSPVTLLVFERDGAAGRSAPGALSDELTAVANGAQALGADRAVFRRPDTPWPADLVLGPLPPRLPEPTITTRKNAGGTPTFPARYPPANDPLIADLIRELGGEDVVP